MPPSSVDVAPSEAQNLESEDTPNAIPVLVEFLRTVPHPLTSVLVGLSPCLSKIRSIAEIISWKSSWYDSWLCLATWWGVCLLAEAGLRYLLPVALLITWSIMKAHSHPASPPITEHNLQTAISDLAITQSLIPSYSFADLPSPSTSVLLRVSAILYVPYLLVTHFVRLRVILGIIGTIFLTWRAPWAYTIRSTIWRSAWVRWTLYHTWSRLSGHSILPHNLTLQTRSTSPQAANSIRFLFTIYENQRWWMGLDWTAALLPGERPSWCSAAQHAVSPPNAFTLPETTTAFLADGKGGRVKRTATWRWEEGEWTVLTRVDGGSVSRVERPLSSGKEESPSGSRLLKAAGKIKEWNNSSSLGGPSDNANADEGGADVEGDGKDDSAQDPSTDADGWVYGDNKWEGQSSKGGIGKFTRYRRWTRIAVVSEVVELVEGGELGIQRERSSRTLHPNSNAEVGVPVEHEVEKLKATENDSMTLRQRLTKAMAQESPRSDS